MWSCLLFGLVLFSFSAVLFSFSVVLFIFWGGPGPLLSLEILTFFGRVIVKDKVLGFQSIKYILLIGKSHFILSLYAFIYHFGFETSSGHKILRRSDLKQPQVPETRLKIDFDRFFNLYRVDFFYKFAIIKFRHFNFFHQSMPFV